jgi:hypothetical protein
MEQVNDPSACSFLLLITVAPSIDYTYLLKAKEEVG